MHGLRKSRIISYYLADQCERLRVVCVQIGFLQALVLYLLACHMKMTGVVCAAVYICMWLPESIAITYLDVFAYFFFVCLWFITNVCVTPCDTPQRFVRLPSIFIFINVLCVCKNIYVSNSKF